MWGLEHVERPDVLVKRTISSRLARYSYGIEMSHDFNIRIHYPWEKWQHPWGDWLAQEQMTWLLRRVSARKVFSERRTSDRPGRCFQGKPDPHTGLLHSRKGRRPRQGSKGIRRGVVVLRDRQYSYPRL